MNVESMNALSAAATIELFRQCCGATAWCEGIASLRPFADLAALHQAADIAFDRLAKPDWIEAFSFHPKIGDIDSLRMKYAGNEHWSASEQSGVSQADDHTIRQLIAGNREYETRFGYIFIVCASGKQATEMLGILGSRLHNDTAKELGVAADEQRKITHLRIDKLLNSTT
jgi:2-oxo-4-hydroxy-4-carboxy-5-ureidoimidazoline decarboxylase